MANSKSAKQHLITGNPPMLRVNVKKKLPKEPALKLAIPPVDARLRALSPTFNRRLSTDTSFTGVTEMTGVTAITGVSKGTGVGGLSTLAPLRRASTLRGVDTVLGDDFFERLVLNRVRSFGAAAGGVAAHEERLRAIDNRYDAQQRRAREQSRRRANADEGGAKWDPTGDFVEARVLVHAVAAGHLSRVRELLRSGYPINCCDSRMRSTLFLAVSGGQKRLSLRSKQPQRHWNREDHGHEQKSFQRHEADASAEIGAEAEQKAADTDVHTVTNAVSEVVNATVNDMVADAVTDTVESQMQNRNASDAREPQQEECEEAKKESLPEESLIMIAERARMRATGEMTPRTRQRKEATRRRREARDKSERIKQARFDARAEAACEAMRGAVVEEQVHVDMVSLLLRACPRQRIWDFLHASNSAGVTPLHACSALGRIASARLLLEEGADTMLTDAEGRTACDYARLCGHTVLARELYESESCVRARGHVQASAGTRMNTPEMETLTHINLRHSAVWEQTHTGGSTGNRSSGGLEIVCVAAHAGDFSKVRDVIAAGHELSRTFESYRPGASALHLAARGGAKGGSIELPSDAFLAVVRHLLWVCPAEWLHHMLNEQRVDEGGYTALMAAAAQGRVKTLRLLLDAGADVSVQDDHGATALDWARVCGRPAAVKLLRAVHRHRNIPQSRVADQVLDGQLLP